MTDAEKRELALAAVQEATEAAAVLSRYAREGADWPEPFGHEEPIEKLLDAAKMAMEIVATPTGAEETLDSDPRADFGDHLQVYGAIENLLEGWVP